MATTPTLINALNLIRGASSPTYKDRIPTATQENLATVGNALITYTDSMNEFLSGLINRIAFTLIRNKDFNNPLEILKQGGMPYGFDIQEIYTNPAVGENYNAKSTDLLSQKEPDVKECFHRLNRRQRYTATVSKADIKTAFTSFENLDKLINSIVNSLYSGNYIDEFLLCKHLFTNAYEHSKLLSTTITEVTDATTAKNFIKLARSIYSAFQFPSTSWNSWTQQEGQGTITTWTNPEDIIMMMTAEMQAEIDVEVMASAFNIDKTTLLGNIITVDNFGVVEAGTASPIRAVMFDKTFTQIWDNERTFEIFRNPSNLTENLYYHVWQTYSTSPFANAVAFTIATV